jgi:hypothetical protein
MNRWIDRGEFSESKKEERQCTGTEMSDTLKMMRTRECAKHAPWSSSVKC